MAKVYLSLGSNIEATKYIVAALDFLAVEFTDLQISSVFESVAVGFRGDNFYNLVVAIDTDLSVGELSILLKKIEDTNGRDRSGPKFSGRTLDIDILTYDYFLGIIDGVELPRAEILINAFVLWPLAEIASEEVHPQADKSYAELWACYDKSSQQLWPINFEWCGQAISHAL